MSTKEESCSAGENSICSLALDAHHQLDVCCESLADKSVVRDYIEQLEEKIEKQQKALDLLEKTRKILIHAKAEQLQGVYFICGEAGEKDDMGLPSHVFICPAHGLDGFAVYKKEKDYDAPGY
jgi:hypothetical protein